MLNIFTNVVANNIFSFEDRDPPWTSEYIKSKFSWKNFIYNQYVNSSRNHADYEILQQAVSEVLELVDDTKNIYYDMLANILTPQIAVKHIVPS